MIELLYDCDLTMGLRDRDVDDGLALMALLGHPEIRLLGVTSTFGNGSVEEVHPCLVATLKTLGSEETPCHRGAPSPRNRFSPAAVFLAETAARLCSGGFGKVRILATGALTNLYGAALHDPGFFEHVSEIVLMGGVTEPLVIGGRTMGELNLACDPEAAFQVLHSGARITAVTGNLCLEGFLQRRRLFEKLGKLPKGIRTLLQESLEPWLAWYRRKYGVEGFHPWDAIAAVYLTDPDLFNAQEQVLLSGLEELRSGLLRTSSPLAPPSGNGSFASSSAADGTRINLPTGLRDPEAVHDRLFEAWGRLGERLEARGGNLQ
jgi:purine nucleosidase